MRRTCATPGRILPDDDRAAARARRNHRSRRTASSTSKRPSAWTNASARRTTPSRPSRCDAAASSISSWAAWAASPKPSACTTSRRPPAFRCGAAACSKSGIGRAHNIALATLPNFVLPGDVSASRRYWTRDIIQPPVEVPPRAEPSRFATSPASATSSTAISCAAITVRQESVR